MPPLRLLTGLRPSAAAGAARGSKSGAAGKPIASSARLATSAPANQKTHRRHIRSQRLVAVCVSAEQRRRVGASPARPIHHGSSACGGSPAAHRSGSVPPSASQSRRCPSVQTPRGFSYPVRGHDDDVLEADVDVVLRDGQGRLDREDHAGLEHVDRPLTSCTSMPTKWPSAWRGLCRSRATNRSAASRTRVGNLRAWTMRSIFANAAREIGAAPCRA